MRYFLSIDTSGKNKKHFSFQNKLINKYLEIENKYKPEKYINLTTLQYYRKKPGLIEKNWNNPFYNNEKYFLFVGGSVIWRNDYRQRGIVPCPREVFEIINEFGKNHYRILKGNYYIVLLDKKSQKICLYSSPMFMHPSFLYYKDRHFLFTNYFDAFFEYIPFNVNKQALVEVSLFDHTIYNKTIINDIKSIPGGHEIVIENDSVKFNLVYDFAKWFISSPLKRKDSLEPINSALKNSINNYISNTDEFNISLTGGFDGRLNLSLIENSDYFRMRAISYGMPGSRQIQIPQKISNELGFEYFPVLLNKSFENVYSQFGLTAINLTCGITGFNRAVYPYSYNIIKDYSRSCILGQCDMIRPLFNNPAGVIFNRFSNSIFFNDYKTFKEHCLGFKSNTYFDSFLLSNEPIEAIYTEIKDRYISEYSFLPPKIRFYFFLLKESLMKYWQTEFHLVDLFVDDYVTFADLDYLETLFNTEYAGIYKGILASNQLERRRGQDLYVDLMTLNNNALNYIMLDRNFMPGWLKFGFLGWLVAGFGKSYGKFKARKIKNDTFDSNKWSEIFYKDNQSQITQSSELFNNKNIKTTLEKGKSSSDEKYRFNRAISLKIWLENTN